MGTYDLFAPAEGWFFVHGNQNGGVIIHRVAVWAQRKGGPVIGLISANIRGPYEVQSLTEPPPVHGDYLHFDDLTPREQAQLRDGTYRRTFG